MISAMYFDGLRARAFPVELHILSGELHILGLKDDKRVSLNTTTLQEPFANAPGILDLGDGSHCEISDPAQQRDLQSALSYHMSWVERWQAHWHTALLAVILMLGILVSGYVWGLPKLADIVSERVPDQLELSMGQQLLPALEITLFQPSRLSDQRIHQVEAVFASIKPQRTRLPVHVIVRDVPALGPNALALPGGTIVVTDQMVKLITGVNQELEGGLAEEMAGVLAHEIGHIEHKHALKGLFHDSILTAASATLFGDFSVVASAVPTLLIRSEYSREMESQADDYALHLLQQHNISPSRLADVLEALQALHESNPAAAMPRWMRKTTDFTASHPPTVARIAKLRGFPVPPG